MSFTEYPIHIDQLCVGVFVRIDEIAHSNKFPKRGFKIKSDKDIQRIRNSGIKHVICVLSKSERMPLPLEDVAPPTSSPDQSSLFPGSKTPISRELMSLKKETLEKNKERRQHFAKCERKYDTTVSRVVQVMRRASGKSEDAVGEASEVVDVMVGTFLSDRDVVLNLMNTKPTEARSHYHALNVTVLSLMLGKELRLKSHAMGILGMGALFHDIGKGRIPIEELSHGKATAMRYAVQKNYQMHPMIGARLVKQFPNFPNQAVHIVLQHHEAVNGKGFPSKLAGEKISPLARIVSIADSYDTLCNQQDGKEPLTPHEALKYMYSRQRTMLDHRFLGVFIKNLGVYPPGTIVQLSNGMTGIVVTINPKQSTRPSIQIYHSEIPKKESLIIDLTIEPDLEIISTMRPDELSREVFQYLSPSRQISYYADNLPE